MIRRLMTRRSGVLAHSLSAAASSAVAQAVVAVVFILAARRDGPTEFGSLTSNMSVVAIVVGLVDFGTNSFWVRELARGALGAGEFTRRAVAKTVVTMAAVGVAALAVDRSGLLLPLLCFGVLTGAGQLIQAPLRARLQLNVLAATAVLDRVVALAVFLALPGSWGAGALLVALSAGLCVSTSLNGWRARGALAAMPGPGAARARGWLAANPWRGSTWYGLSSATSTLQGLDLPITSALGGLAAGGAYAAVTRWTQPFGLLIGAFTSAVAPRAATATSFEDLRRLARGSLLIPLVSIGGALVFAVVCPALVPLLLGARYASATGALQILVISTIPAICNQPLVVVMHAIGQDRASALLTSVAVAAQMAVLVPLASALGAVGAATASLTFQLVLLTTHLVLLWRFAHRTGVERQAVTPRTADAPPRRSGSQAVGALRRSDARRPLRVR